MSSRGNKEDSKKKLEQIVNKVRDPQWIKNLELSIKQCFKQ